ncbi:hypothetical protein OAR04_01835 [Flavobacteriales bacterium]|nr:hypothetical protein [Flavobacteriales bacterium]
MGEGKGRNFVDGSESVEVLLEMVLTSDHPSTVIVMIYSTTQFTNPATFNQFRKELKNKNPELYLTIKELENKIKVQDKNNSSNSEGCYIATATMGDFNHPIVVDLRNFRDLFLLKSIFGKLFIKSYYFFSPFLAKLISKSNFLKFLSLNLLIKPIYRLIKKYKNGTI